MPGTDFYVYTHSRPDGSIFYVGKGRAYRAFNFKKRNAHHRAIVTKYGEANIKISIIAQHLTEQDAFAAEILWIKLLGKDCLANMTDGGEGNSGHVVTEKHRKAVSEATKKRMENPEYRRARVTALMCVSSDPVKLAERNKKISDAKSTAEGRKRNSEAMLKALRTPEFREKRSTISKRIWLQDQMRERRAVAQAARWADPDFKKHQLSLMQNSPNRPESRKRQAEKMRLRHQDPEYRARISAAIREGKRRVK